MPNKYQIDPYSAVKYYPEEIIRLLEKEGDLQGNKIDYLSNISYNIIFSNTTQGRSFWEQLYLGNLRPYYDMYGSSFDNKIEINIIQEEPVIIYKGIVNNRKVKITIEYED